MPIRLDPDSINPMRNNDEVLRCARGAWHGARSLDGHYRRPYASDPLLLARPRPSDDEIFGESYRGGTAGARWISDHAGAQLLALLFPQAEPPTTGLYAAHIF